jgi:hypothetical protein
MRCSPAWDDDKVWEIGADALVRARACDVPDWQRVVRVERRDEGAAFVYEDGKEWVLPGLQPV